MRGFFISMAKIADLIFQAKQKYREQPDVLAIEVWLADCLGKSKEYLFLERNSDVSEQQEQRFWMGIDRMIEGEPLAQIRGKKEFYGIDFVVNEHVLIPRPESELVVELARKYIKENSARTTFNVVDVGSGSGCILLALSKVEKAVNGLGLEISEQAIQVAEKNLLNLDLSQRVAFRHSDLFEAVGDFYPEIILANLPYIGTEKFNFVAKDVEKYEPKIALFGGPDGLDLYRKLFDQINGLPKKPQIVIGEFGFGQAEKMTELLSEKFSNIVSREIIDDLAGIPRVFVLRW